jgi:hypothetical protein
LELPSYILLLSKGRQIPPKRPYSYTKLKWATAQKTRNVGSLEVPTAVVMNSSVFWDITQCSPLKANRRFRRTCRPHLQGRGITPARNQPICLRRLIFNGLHGVISQNIELFILLPSRWRQKVSPKRWRRYIKLQGPIPTRQVIFSIYTR